jgi:hypothetical protein
MNFLGVLVCEMAELEAERAWGGRIFGAEEARE